MQRAKTVYPLSRFRTGRGRAGFSMVELMVVIVVLAVLSVAGLLLIFYLFQSMNYSQSDGALYSAVFVALNEISSDIRKGNALYISANTDTLRLAEINNAVIESLRIYNSGAVIIRSKYYPLPVMTDTVASLYLQGIGAIRAQYAGAPDSGRIVFSVRAQSAGAATDTLVLSRWTQARSW